MRIFFGLPLRTAKTTTERVTIPSYRFFFHVGATSFAFTSAETFPMSARPASPGFRTPITLPMSAGDFAPVAASASATAASSSACDICFGRYASITEIS